MRFIKFEEIVAAVESLCKQAAYELNDDIISALIEAKGCESSDSAVGIIEQLLENARIAKEEKIPLCQDTGITVVFVEQGSEAAIQSGGGATIVDAINTGVEAGYRKGYLRKSVVYSPVGERRNTGSNTPAIIHFAIVPGDKLKLTVMAKGGGCENKSRFKMFNPTAESEEVVDWIVSVASDAGADACPPFIVGVGIGGDFELSCLLSKKALLRNLRELNSDVFYADIERELLSKINKLGIGPQGLGGDTTALACLIETAPCHIASLPVAVNIECHSHRHKSVIL